MRRTRNPIISLMAEEGIRALGQALPRVIAATRRPRRARRCLYGAWLCGTVLGSVGMALASQAVPHARRHFQSAARGDAHDRAAARARLQPCGCARGDEAHRARALHADDAAQAVFDLAHDHGAPTALKDIGLTRSRPGSSRSISR